MGTHRIQSRNRIDQEVYLGDHVNSRVSSVNFLGLYYDEHVGWVGHIEYLVMVVSKFMFILRKIKSHLPGSSLFLTLNYVDILT